MRSKVIFGHPKWPPAAILWEKKSNLRIDLKWREMRSKVIFGHPKWPPAAILWEKESNLRIDLKWREMRSKVIFGHPKWGEGASQWPACENHSGKYTNSIYILRKPMLHSHAQPTHCAITRTMIFGHPKWAPVAILWIQVAYWSEMARNAIESDFRSSKMAAGSHFVRKKIKLAYWSEMARNAIESDFRSSKMGGGGITMASLWEPFGQIHQFYLYTA